ncbi:MAG TPA: RES family NAD+ phosphorylase [Gemmatimonadaceae bacterium]|nr:RES family NAD+ phosphorylase [Gemmatimonadaceae bacterium]
MSSSIWTRCAGASELRPLRQSPWRAVEAQHHLSTRKLVRSAEEQELLEELIERTKPPDRHAGRAHYLLSTPFRYPPLPHGSRFGRRHEAGVWYGSETRRTVFAEVAYYRCVFLAGTRADLGTVMTELTVFTVLARTRRGIDLTVSPFDRYRRAIASPEKYDATQALGAAMRAAGVELVRYPSARDPEGGVNIAAFTPAVFGRAKPRDLQTWHCTATPDRVELTKRDYFGRERYAFAREDFLVHGSLPQPAL